MNDNKTNKELEQLICHYLPYWPYFLVSLLICIVFGMLYLRYSTPIYDISASILIKDGNDDNNKNADTFLTSLDIFSYKKIVDNEKEILHSHTLMDEVVRKMGLYAPIYQKGIIHNTSAYTLSPICIRLRFPDSLQGTKQKIFFKYDSNLKKIVINHIFYPLKIWSKSPWGIIQFITNPNYTAPLANKEEEFFFSFIDVRKVADGLLANMDVESPTKLSTVININLKDPDPQRGKDVLNELIRYYNVEALRDKNKVAANSLSFLDERLHYVTGSLDSIEKQLQNFKADKGVVDLDEQGKLILGSVETNDQKVNEINVQLAVLEQIENHVKQNVGNNPGIILSTGNVTNVLSDYLNSLYKDEIEYDRLSKTTAQNNPILLSLKDQIDKIRPTILKYIEDQISSLETSKTNLEATTGKYASVIRSIPTKERELLEISRQQTIKNNLYAYLLKKREEAALSYAASVSDVRIIDNAHVGTAPVSPKKSMILGIAALLGLCLPAAFFAFNKKIVSKLEIQEILGFPILGEISNASSGSGIIKGGNKLEFVPEQYRQIITSLASFVNTKNKKTILITSSVTNEGKSFIAANLAYNLAVLGKKTVLIELDLRKSDISSSIGSGSNEGISGFLNGQTGAEEIIVKTTVHPNFFLIPSGEIPPNPVELLLNGTLRGYLSYLEDIFDYIIIETAPIGLFTDGFIVSDMCDVTLFIVRYNVTPRTELISLKENLKVRSLKNPVIAFNGVKNLGLKRYGTNYYSYVKRKNKPLKSFV